MSDVEADPQQRVRLDVSYDGTDFAGWARQPDQRTVEAVLENALATVLRIASPRLRVAGRTDSGVHAIGQVAHLDVPADVWAVQSGSVLRRLAGVLPADVRVRDVRPVPPAFDARFAALWRRYEYRITDGPGGVDPLRRHFVLAWPRRLDTEVMSEAAAQLTGLRDFVAFCKHRAVATTIRDLHRLDVVRVGDELLVTVTADAFCHSMVRSLVGGLLAVGEGRQDLDWLISLLTLDRRSDEVTVAPARGLTLVEVGYPPEDQFAARAGLTRARRVAS